MCGHWHQCHKCDHESAHCDEHGGVDKSREQMRDHIAKEHGK